LFRGPTPRPSSVDLYVNSLMNEGFESILNPEYDMDFRAYMVNRMQQDALEAEAGDAAPMTRAPGQGHGSWSCVRPVLKMVP
jgi:hypothetical protein